MRYAGQAALAATLVVLASGCGSPAAPAPSTSASASASPSPKTESATTALPTSLPSGPPNGPTDNDKPTGWIFGTVTAGGTGPCYGLETDDGVPYALHSTAGIRLDRGAHVRIKGTPARIKIYCGPGKLLEMTAAEPVR